MKPAPLKRLKPTTKRGVWVDKNGEIVIRKGVALRDLEEGEEIGWMGEEND